LTDAGDQVTFGSVRQILPLQHAEAKRVLEAAETAIGDEVLTEYEEGFTKSALEGIRKQGHRWDLSVSRQGVVDDIERKLKAEGLL
jgi:hypothetical protein